MYFCSLFLAYVHKRSGEMMFYFHAVKLELRVRFKTKRWRYFKIWNHTLSKVYHVIVDV